MRCESTTDLADTEDVVLLILVNLLKLRMHQYLHGCFTTREKQQHLLAPLKAVKLCTLERNP